MGAERGRQQRVDRRTAAWKLRVQGWTQERIAEELCCSQQTVSLDLRAEEKRLYAEFTQQAEEIKARQTAQLEAVYEELVEQWRRSCQDAERVTTVTGRTTQAGLPLPDQETRSVEGQSGNPALLDKAMKALEDIRAIWGLEAPKKQEIAGPEGGPIQIREVVVELPADGG